MKMSYQGSDGKRRGWSDEARKKAAEARKSHGGLKVGDRVHDKSTGWNATVTKVIENPSKTKGYQGLGNKPHATVRFTTGYNKGTTADIKTNKLKHLSTEQVGKRTGASKDPESYWAKHGSPATKASFGIKGKKRK